MPGHNLPLGEKSPETPPETDVAPVSTFLQKTYAALEKSATDLLATARGLPKLVDSDETMGKLASSVRDMAALAKKAEADRVREKEPYYRGGQAVDAFFGAIKDRLNTAVKILETRISTYREEKQAEEEARALAAAQAAAAEARDAAAKIADAPTAAIASERQIDATVAAMRASNTMQQLAKSVERAPVTFEGGVRVGNKTEKVVTVEDYDALPLDKLRPYIKRDALLAAVKEFAKVTKYEEQLPGATIVKRQGTRVT